jgi:predicted nucleic acid-binding protein
VILVDTSVWVEYDRASGGAADARLTRLIEDDGPIAVTEPVVMEVLAGARDEARERDLRRLLARFALLRLDPVADFDGAVHIYRRCRQRGVTPRGLIACLIATVAMRHGASLLAHDRDLAAIAGLMDLELEDGSLGRGSPLDGSAG